MAIVMYRTKWWLDTKINKVECEKETEKMVWVIRKFKDFYDREITEVDRKLKIAEFEQYHKTWEDAQDYLLRNAETKLKRLKQQTAEANETVHRIKKMKKE